MKNYLLVCAFLISNYAIAAKVDSTFANLVSGFQFKKLPDGIHLVENEELTEFDKWILEKSKDEGDSEIFAFRTLDSNGNALSRYWVTGENLKTKNAQFDFLYLAKEFYRDPELHPADVVAIEFYHNPKKSFIFSSRYFSGEDLKQFNLFKALTEYLGFQHATFKAGILYPSVNGEIKKRSLVYPTTVSWKSNDYVIPGGMRSRLKSQRFADQCGKLMDVRRY